MQLYCVLALTCRRRVLQVVQQVPRGHGFEAWRRLCRKFEPRPPVRSSGVLQVLLSPTKSAELKRLVRQWRNRGKGLRGTVWRRGVRLAVSKADDEGPCSPGDIRASSSKTGVCGVWKHEPHRLVAVGQKKRRRVSETVGVFQLRETWPQQGCVQVLLSCEGEEACSTRQS